MIVMKRLAAALFVVLLVSSESLAGAKSPVTLRSPRRPGQVDRVAVLLEVGGDCIERGEEKEERVAMSGVAKLTYDEMTLESDRRPPALGSLLRTGGGGDEVQGWQPQPHLPRRAAADRRGN